MSESNAIGHVQDAETKAKKLVADAEKRKAEKVQKANEKARQIVDGAEARTKEIRDDAVKKAAEQADKEREKSLFEASIAAKKVQKEELGKNKIKDIAEKVVRQIFS